MEGEIGTLPLGSGNKTDEKECKGTFWGVVTFNIVKGVWIIEMHVLKLNRSTLKMCVPFVFSGSKKKLYFIICTFQNKRKTNTELLMTHKLKYLRSVLQNSYKN